MGFDKVGVASHWLLKNPSLMGNRENFREEVRGVRTDVLMNAEIYDLLTSIDEEFYEFEKNFKTFSSAEAYNKLVSLIHLLIYGVLKAEVRGWIREDIRALLSNTWRIHGYSSFVKHIQTWPRGYMADFEVINMIADRKEEAPPETIGGLIGRYALNSPIAQQHREKLKIQTEAIKEVCKKISKPKILSLACGSSRDFEPVVYELKEAEAKILLVDFEPEALKESVRRLSEISGQIETLLVDIRRLKSFFKGLSEKDGEFHLILAGGLFDYLSSGIVKMIIRNVFENFLHRDGLFIFTNIAQENPYRAWIETMGNWQLIERSQEDIKELLKSINLAEYQLTKEPTGLTWIVYLVKKSIESPR